MVQSHFPRSKGDASSVTMESGHGGKAAALSKELNTASVNQPTKRKASGEVDVPPEFRQNILESQNNKIFYEAVAEYYLSLPSGDSRTISGKSGLLEKMLIGDPRRRMKGKQNGEGSTWRPIKIIGQGSYAQVFLWEKDCGGGNVRYENQISDYQMVSPDAKSGNRVSS